MHRMCEVGMVYHTNELSYYTKCNSTVTSVQSNRKTIIISEYFTDQLKINHSFQSLILFSPSMQTQHHT